MKKKVLLKIDEKLIGKTVKEVLQFFSVGRGKIEELRVNKAIFLNDVQIDLNYKCNLHDNIIFVSEETPNKGVKKDIHILYEDDDFIAVYKDKGLLVHSDGTGIDTLIDYVALYLDDSVVYPINRIDVDTSGIVIFAKHFLSSCAINKMVENHELIKIYLAKVKGKMPKKSGKIECMLGKDRHDAKKMIVKTKEGLKAITFYDVLEEYKDSSLLKVRIVTGRKHQIRVSLASINHPIVGDKLYGNKFDNEKLALEASYLSFINPINNSKIEVYTDNFKKYKN